MLLRNRTLLMMVAAGMIAVVVSPTILAYNGGVSSQDLEYDCGGSCHKAVSTSTITIAASNVTPEPGGHVTLWVNVSGGEASDSPLGVMIVSSTSTSDSQPSVDGWTIVADPGGSTSFNYYEIESYTGSCSFMWELTAPTAVGLHMLYAREMHGDGGMYAKDSAGLPFTVTVYTDDGGDDGGDDDGTDTNIPTIVITSPSNAETVKGNVTVSVFVDSDDPIVSASLSIGRTLVSEKTAPPFEWFIDTTNLTEGGHVFTVSVTDSTGDTVTDEVVVFVDNESEVVSMLEWLVTMLGGTVAIISISGIMIVGALYLRKRMIARRVR